MWSINGWIQLLHVENNITLSFLAISSHIGVFIVGIVFGPRVDAMSLGYIGQPLSISFTSPCFANQNNEKTMLVSYSKATLCCLLVHNGSKVTFEGILYESLRSDLYVWLSAQLSISISYWSTLCLDYSTKTDVLFPVTILLLVGNLKDVLKVQNENPQKYTKLCSKSLTNFWKSLREVSRRARQREFLRKRYSYRAEDKHKDVGRYV